MRLLGLRSTRFSSVLTVACVFKICTPAPSSAQQPGVASDSEIRSILKDRIDAKLGTGFVVGIIEPNGTRRTVAYGTSGTARPLDGNSVFEIGSITKTFTAAVLADMVVRGEVRLDDPVAKYLPATAKVPSQGERQITLLDLATQSSGLPRMPTNFAPKDALNPYADYTPALLYTFLASYQLPRAIGAEFEYSNIGLGLLGHALTLKAGTDLETLYRQRVLGPLHMDDTRIALTPSMRERLALGHDDKGGVVPNWDLDAMAGAGALRSTVKDMMSYVAANIAADADSTKGPLGRALRLAHERRRGAGSAAMNIGLAWHLFSPPGGGTIVWHNGGTGGYRTFSGYDPEHRVGIVVLGNANISVDDIAIHLLVPSIPLRPPVIQPAAKVRTEVTLPAQVLDRYVGDYALAPTFHIVITRDDTGLVATPTGQGKAPLFAEREDEFFFKVVDAQITFTRDAAGAVSGLVLHQNGRNMPALKVRVGGSE